MILTLGKPHNEGYESRDVRAKMWMEIVSQSAQMKSEEMVSL